MIDSPLIIIPFMINLCLLLVAPLLYLTAFDDEKIGFKMVVAIQILIRYSLEDELSNFGIIILQVLVSILSFPYMVVMTIAVVIKYILEYIWNWYKYIFKKKERIE